ncbi:MAG TPA: NAD-dependent epimerase/dehydratase family protein [Phycisphaerae bacterium]|jgi:dihydroflavonol-4-reductase|nr:NAD-dependent epimerase/dehydratase family protein [Phycisphaerae bacterium]HOB74137.1 NAD-dependent epimerase/dehydratase family protein [Phycisphaerae bacterium]HOJ56406.1 NAD-dependent epimerase/dehydratase family protein [Phycisphaerae bacterium]HOL28236.1 NAD-dependent epimerase/dehydratase family protein [Phycisphaerae bacterium]HPP22491.1 NAD-dependent epimerase/dehydratase family protein [Phycisphaerae bacterium]
MQRILVTGASGFTGGYLCKRLAAEGHRVKALVRPQRPVDALLSAGVEPVRGDLRDRSSLRNALKGVETVYHIAALYRDGRASRADLFADNLGGTRNLLAASIRADVGRFVHCSTVGVHGDVRHPPANEDAPFAPGDDYQESKAAAEQFVRHALEKGRLPITIFRPSGIYGPGDLRFLKLFKAIQRQRFVMVGAGDVLYHLVHIDDLVDGIILCGTRPEAIGRTYILAGPRYTTLRELIELIAGVLNVRPTMCRVPFWPVYATAAACEFVCKPLGLSPPLFRRRVDFFRKSRAFDISRARSEIGYAPKVELEEGLAQTAEWYMQQGLLKRDVTRQCTRKITIGPPCQRLAGVGLGLLTSAGLIRAVFDLTGGA